MMLRNLRCEHFLRLERNIRKFILSILLTFVFFFLIMILKKIMICQIVPRRRTLGTKTGNSGLIIPAKFHHSQSSWFFVTFFVASPYYWRLDLLVSVAVISFLYQQYFFTISLSHDSAYLVHAKKYFFA